MRELSDDELDAIVRKTWGNGWMLPGEPQRMLVRAGYAAGYAAAQAAMPPREPTPEMVAAGTAAHSRSPVFEAQRIIDIWYAMHDAHTFAEDSARYYGFPPDDAGPLDHQPCIERGCPNPSLMPKSEYCAYHARREPQQSAATPSPTTEFLGTIGAAQAATDGPAADPLPVAWATPSLLVTLSAVEKNHLTNPDRRTRGGEFESAAADAERYSVPLYAAPPAQAEPQEGDLLHTMMEWARTEEGRKQLADSYRPHLWACAKRVADPQNEAATCRHWCGDIEHCQPIASAPAQAEPQPEHAGPIAWLRTLNGDPDWQEDCVHAYEDDARRNLNAYIEGAGEGEVYSIIPLYAASPAQAEPQPDPTPNLGPFSSSLGVAAPDVAALVEPQAEAIPIAPVEVVRQALKELLESISECRMDQVTARFAKASVMARAVVDRYKDAT